MNERDDSMFSTVLNVIALAFATLGVYAIVSSFRDDDEREHIVTSHGRKIYFIAVPVPSHSTDAVADKTIPISEHPRESPEPTE
jgi:hypothetical protein